MINNQLIPLSLYVHTPWCVQKCPYCDFNSHTLREPLAEKAYTDALCEEFEQRLPLLAGRPIQTIFIGGGTPSLFSADAFARLFDFIRRYALLTDNAEITLEANPGVSEQARFNDYRQIGINRLSLGIQSFHEDKLKALGRIHDSQQAHRAIDIAKTAGFTNFNLDLMFGLPEQTQQQALEDLRLACAHAPPHLSWYQLTLEPNTLFHKFPPALPDEDALWEIQQAGIAYLHEQGLQRYEVSAYSRTDHEARHNLNYWTFGDYLGIGAGAHSKITTDDQRILRISNIKHPTLYLKQSDKTATHETLPASALAFEFMLNHLRLLRPIDLELFEKRTGLSSTVLDKTIAQAHALNFMKTQGKQITLTPHGENFLNDVVALFLAGTSTQ